VYGWEGQSIVLFQRLLCGFLPSSLATVSSGCVSGTALCVGEHVERLSQHGHT